MDIHCPRCRTRYHLESALTPRRVMRLRCAACEHEFRIDLTDAARRSSSRDRVGTDEVWARRVARTLISDMVIYHRARRDAALSDGTLLDVFAEDLAVAWDVFRDRTGDGTYDHLFRDAVNTILAAGRPLL